MARGLSYRAVPERYPSLRALKSALSWCADDADEDRRLRSMCFQGRGKPIAWSCFRERSRDQECGMRYVECGMNRMRNCDYQAVRLTLIPHSAFHIPHSNVPP